VLILAVVLCAFVLCSCSKEDKNKALNRTASNDPEAKINKLLLERKKFKREQLENDLRIAQIRKKEILNNKEICDLTDDERCLRYDMESEFGICDTLINLYQEELEELK
jgi:hypothetical protein